MGTAKFDVGQRVFIKTSFQTVSGTVIAKRQGLLYWRYLVKYMVDDAEDGTRYAEAKFRAQWRIWS